MVRERRTQINTMNKNTRDTRFIPRFGHITKVTIKVKPTH
jgi:hypothetical protein